MLRASAAEVALAEFHLDERVGQRAEAHAAVFRRDEGAPETLRAGLCAQFGEHFLIRTVLELLLGGDAFVLDELADALTYFLRFGGNLEVDHVVTSCVVGIV